MERSVFELCMREIGFFVNHKALFYYANGKSKVLKRFVDIAKQSKIPRRFELAVAIKIVDRKSNGAVPSWVDALPVRDKMDWEMEYFRWWNLINKKTIYSVYARMDHGSLDRYNFCIAEIDRINLGKKYY